MATSSATSNTGKLVYACMISSGNVLAFTGAEEEKIGKVISVIAENVDYQVETKRPFGTYEELLYVYLVAENTLWIAVSHEGLALRKIFAFLETIRSHFSEKYDAQVDKLSANKYSRYMHEQMVYWATDPSADKLSTVLTQVEAVKEQMVANMAAIIDRGEKLDNIDQEAVKLEQSAAEFHSEAKKLKCQLCKSLWCCGCCACCNADNCPCCVD
mmetsp:Transcript_9599/g.14457  ORF Transcript_9599/g.14457 Transcript_9599/m.14457 type:complete len:214 (-) Transcript_9599:79-720(-)